MNGKYDDIIDLPHQESTSRPRMSRENRAAQFSPFAALTGYDAAIKETGRLTDKKIELGESAISELDNKLRILADMLPERPEISVTHFHPDEKKEGGVYITTTGELKRIDGIRRAIIFMDGESVAISDILEIDCERFGEFI